MARTQRPELLAAMLTYLMALNLFDLFSTVFMIGIGAARELNPVMKHVLLMGPSAILFVKVYLPFLVGQSVWRQRMSCWALTVPMVMYTALVIYQVTGMLLMIPAFQNCGLKFFHGS